MWNDLKKNDSNSESCRYCALGIEYELYFYLHCRQHLEEVNMDVQVCQAEEVLSKQPS